MQIARCSKKRVANRSLPKRLQVREMNRYGSSQKGIVLSGREVRGITSAPCTGDSASAPENRADVQGPSTSVRGLKRAPLNDHPHRLLAGIPSAGPRRGRRPEEAAAWTTVGWGSDNPHRMPKITPFLWFDNQAEEAASFYVSIFRNSKIVKKARYGEAGPGPKGGVTTMVFQLDGQEFIALNGGPQFKFTEAVSFTVDCKTQQEVDEFWEKLSRGGEEGPCGWLKDKFGLSWQIVPTVLGEMLSDPDARKSERVMQAMLKMKKIDIEALKRAYEGR